MATQARSIASLTISFGLVAIPVKLYSATVSSERISFNLLRQKDGSRVKQQYVAVNDGKLVERRGLGHTKKLTPKAIAAALTEFLAEPTSQPHH